jgi:hypothetical protein
MPITLGANDTISINGVVVETAKSVTDEGLDLNLNVTSTGIIDPPVIIDANYKYLAFKTAATLYQVTFPHPMNCDILVVGGGGGGGEGSYENGGGGGGGIVYMVNKLFVPGTTYDVRVGSGGAANTRGSDSKITTSVTRIILSGPVTEDIPISFDNISVIGRGGGRGNAVSPLSSGGSGGGGNSRFGIMTGSIATQGNTFWDGTTYVAGGFNGQDGSSYSGGGGGGAGEVGGTDGSLEGGDGRQVNITGTNVFYGGGGAGGGAGTTSGGDGGGGGAGNWSSSGGNGTVNTGGGGGGAYSVNTTSGGSGGSGIVIIRYPRKNFINAQWIYNAVNANVYYPSGGNVGIGITNPTNALHVNGTMFSTTFSGGTKTFKIEHPLKLKKWLYHGCLEGPRFDNIYRGKTLIINGKAEVDIDKECNTTRGMTPGTFPALNTNYQLYLQNNKTFDRVKGKIFGSKILIESSNITDEIEIEWLVIGERHDVTVINPEFTDNDGNLICEHEMIETVNANATPVTNVDIVD